MSYPPFPSGTPDEAEMYLRWLAFLRGAVLRKAAGLTEEQSRWQPDGKLIPLIGIVNHLTGVEARWIDGEMLGREVGEPDDEYSPGASLTIKDAITAYEARAAATDATIRQISDLTTPSRYGQSTDLRFVLVHLINETARHAGHADAVRELLDGTVGE
jgi:uncharacterized damage-inducible protein DinB